MQTAPPSQNTAQAASAGAAGTGRVLSIDALRGFDMFWIIGGKYLFLGLVGALLQPQPVPEWLKTTMEHTRWGGCSFWDLIMPLFLFIVGAAMPFSFSKHLEHGEPKTAIYRRMAKRFAVLWVLGMMVQGNLLALDLSRLKLFSNVLQSIACGYVVTGLVLLHVPRRVHPGITAALLVGYWLALVFIPVPGLGAGVLEDDRNLAAWIDRAILGRFNAGHHTWILTIMTSSAMVMLGMHAGQILQSRRSERSKLLWLLAAGVGGLALGWAWSFSFPINKPLFTSSFVLWSGGWCLLLLALFYGVIDVLRWRAWAFPLIVIGVNPLLAYVLSHLFMDQIAGIGLVLAGGLRKLVEPYGWAVVVRNTAAVGVLWGFLWFLYRKKVFWRV
jgi:predicted acyltransferase